MQTAPTSQTPGVHRQKIGDIVVTSIVDGVLHANFGIVKAIEEADAKAQLAARFRSQEPVITINCFVVHTGGKCVLIDSGAGKNSMFAAGALPTALNAAGVSPDTIDTILMTHLHPDHAGGLVAEDGRAVFPNAELLLHEDEARFWLETSNPPDGMKPFFAAAQSAVAPYKSRMRTYAKGEVAPGIESEPLPGHTPGHTGFHITSGNEQLLMWTDIVHLPMLQARHPDVYLTFDIDPEQAKAHRKRLFDKVATDRLQVAGSHLDFPAFAHLERLGGGGYAFIPEVWRPYI